MPDADHLSVPQRAAARIAFALDVASGALLAAVTLLVIAQVGVRYLLGGSLVWSEELSRLLFVWMVMVAAARAAPMRIGMLVDAMPPRLAALVRLAGEILVAGLTAALVRGAWGLVELTAGDSYIALGISVQWLYMALLVAGILWIARSAIEGWGHLRRALGGGDRP